MNIQTSVFYVGGSKGGVGKSLFSFALVDYLLSRNANILLVDTDTDNPDVFKAHKELALPNLRCRLNSLDDADGWAELLDTVQNYPDHAVVINAAARTKTSTASYGDIMKEALREMRRELVVFWIINRHRDSIELLHSFQELCLAAGVFCGGVAANVATMGEDELGTANGLHEQSRIVIFLLPPGRKKGFPPPSPSQKMSYLKK